MIRLTNGGLPFRDESSLMAALERIASQHETLRACVWVESMDEIARRYIEVAQATLEMP